MNVLIINHHAGSPDSGGGGRHYELGDFLSKKGFKVTILASSYNNATKQYLVDSKIYEKQFNKNFNIIRYKTKPKYKTILGRFINYINFKNIVNKYNNNHPDIIVASSVHPLTWISGYNLAKKYNSKFIVEVRDLWPLSMYEDLSGLVRKIVFSYFNFLEKKYYSLADAIITTAPYANEYMQNKYKINSNKIFHIPHGIDLKEFDYNSENKDILLDISLDQVLKNYFCVTYTGSLSKSEGLDAFIRSFGFLKNTNVKYVIVGSGAEENNLKSLVQKKEERNILFFERQERNTIPKTLKKSKILFTGLIDRQAFKYGISKNKFYDYMAAGKPTVFASNVRGSLIDQSDSGITVPSNDPKAIAKAIDLIYDDYSNLMVRYGKNGRLFVEKYHTNKVIGKKFINVFDYKVEEEND